MPSIVSNHSLHQCRILMSMVHLENNNDMKLIVLSILTQIKSTFYHEINEMHKRFFHINMSKFLDVNCKLLRHIFQGDDNLPPHVWESLNVATTLTWKKFGISIICYSTTWSTSSQLTPFILKYSQLWWKITYKICLPTRYMRPMTKLQYMSMLDKINNKRLKFCNTNICLTCFSLTWMSQFQQQLCINNIAFMWTFWCQPLTIKLSKSSRLGLLITKRVEVLQVFMVTWKRSPMTWIGRNHCKWPIWLPVVAFVTARKSTQNLALKASLMCMSKRAKKGPPMG